MFRLFSQSRLIQCTNLRFITLRSFTRQADDPSAIPPPSTEPISHLSIPKPVRPADEPIEILKKRLTYISRKRGILETDLLLSTFCSAHLDTMPHSQLQEFDSLLEENDWDIYYWATGSRPVPKEWASSPVMKMLVEHSKAKQKRVLRMPDLD